MVINYKYTLEFNNLNFKFTNFKGDIYKNVLNKSLVITSSGLTKYDLFVANIPLVVFCENNSQQKLNLEFKKKFQGYCFNNLIYNKKNRYSYNVCFITTKKQYNTYHLEFLGSRVVFGSP